MFTSTRVVRIEWGDCDPAGIVFYPRYFAIFDHCTAVLFERATGMAKLKMTEFYDAVGMPMVDTRAKFIIPSRYGDEIAIESRVTEFRRSSFDVEHRVTKDGALAIEGFETRVWVGRHPDDPAKLKSMPIPEGIVAKFRRGGQQSG
jgi:4-hydroxybenzoyl-CoA thioesterase